MIRRWFDQLLAAMVTCPLRHRFDIILDSAVGRFERDLFSAIGALLRRFELFSDRCVVPERSNAIIGVVIDLVVVSEYHRAVMADGPKYHGPMVSTG
ncbi:hypothetical protein F511_38392 [Dorcoceras hygrometricum]|uniref:Uncharacterized protein n=1 Tax=Dorcoceras hygrometricum TaxID=472368 RepID=A0A2Z7A8K4_9LAMI|nr:hypothetical protein F511_38392 [Dorcoceras hygrometricum]